MLICRKQLLSSYHQHFYQKYFQISHEKNCRQFHKKQSSTLSLSREQEQCDTVFVQFFRQCDVKVQQSTQQQSISISVFDLSYIYVKFKGISRNIIDIVNGVATNNYNHWLKSEVKPTLCKICTNKRVSDRKQQRDTSLDSLRRFSADSMDVT